MLRRDDHWAAGSTWFRVGVTLIALGAVSGCAASPSGGSTAGNEPPSSGAESASGEPDSAASTAGTYSVLPPGSGGSQGGAGEPESDTGTQPPVAQATPFPAADIPFRGSADATVVVQVFSDFECPFCGRARSHVERLLADFATVRVEYRHFPLSMHQHAAIAAQAAVEAYAQGGNPAFWCYHDALFDHQHQLSRARMLSFASACGVDRQVLDQALQDGRHAAREERDRAEGARLGVDGTPSFTVNGTLVDGSDYPDLEEAVDRALYR